MTMANESRDLMANLHPISALRQQAVVRKPRPEQTFQHLPRLLLVLCLGMAPVVPAPAAVYYVSPAGEDGGRGDLDSPWRSIQKAVDACRPGDTVVLLEGWYGEPVTIRVSGTADNRITVTSQGQAIITNTWTIGTWSVPRHFITLRQLHFQRAGMAVRGNSNVVELCIFEGPSGGLGISSHPTAEPPSEGVIIRSNVFRNFGKVVIMTTGTKTRGVIIEGNAWLDNEGDVIRMFGQGHVFRQNVVSNLMETGFHADIFQIYGNNGEQSLDMLVEGNRFIRSTGSLAMLQNRQGTVPMGRWTFRNNLIYQVVGVAQVSIPYCTFVNNTFVESGRNTAGPILLRFDAEAEYGYAHHTTILNNLFIGCSSYPDGDATGWYHFADRPPDAFTGLAADFNYVTKSAGARYAPKTGFRNLEANGINGGDPMFQDAANPDFRLASESPAIDTGKALDSFHWDILGTARPQGAAWDRGAHEHIFDRERVDVVPPANLRISR